jgi:hypothetical protein
MNSSSELLQGSDTASLKLIEKSINYTSETSLYFLVNRIQFEGAEFGGLISRLIAANL